MVDTKPNQDGKPGSTINQTRIWIILTNAHQTVYWCLTLALQRRGKNYEGLMGVCPPPKKKTCKHPSCKLLQPDYDRWSCGGILIPPWIESF